MLIILGIMLFRNTYQKQWLFVYGLQWNKIDGGRTISMTTIKNNGEYRISNLHETVQKATEIFS